MNYCYLTVVLNIRIWYLSNEKQDRLPHYDINYSSSLISQKIQMFLRMPSDFQNAVCFSHLLSFMPANDIEGQCSSMGCELVVEWVQGRHASIVVVHWNVCNAKRTSVA